MSLSLSSGTIDSLGGSPKNVKHERGGGKVIVMIHSAVMGFEGLQHRTSLEV